MKYDELRLFVRRHRLDAAITGDDDDDDDDSDDVADEILAEVRRAATVAGGSVLA